MTRAHLSDSRALSALELVIGTGIVLGHNVFHVLPNEVPILAVLGLISFRLRGGGWAALPFRRPESWGRIVAIAVAAAALRLVVGRIVETLAARVWPPIVAPAGSEAIAGDLGTALLWLGLVWTWAAFGEEFGYRGYLLTRAADLGPLGERPRPRFRRHVRGDGALSRLADLTLEKENGGAGAPP